MNMSLVKKNMQANPLNQIIRLCKHMQQSLCGKEYIRETTNHSALQASGPELYQKLICKRIDKTFSFAVYALERCVKRICTKKTNHSICKQMHQSLVKKEYVRKTTNLTLICQSINVKVFLFRHFPLSIFIQTSIFWILMIRFMDI